MSMPKWFQKQLENPPLFIWMRAKNSRWIQHTGVGYDFYLGVIRRYIKMLNGRPPKNVKYIPQDGIYPYADFLQDYISIREEQVRDLRDRTLGPWTNHAYPGVSWGKISEYIKFTNGNDWLRREEKAYFDLPFIVIQNKIITYHKKLTKAQYHVIRDLFTEIDK